MIRHPCRRLATGRRLRQVATGDVGLPQAATSARARRGATLVESAFVLSVLFFLLLAVVVGGYGVLRYQQLALLAREGARYAAVHGGQYAQETGNPAATADDVYKNAILPYAVNLDPANLLMHGFDVFASVRDLRGSIVHAHAKDARAAGASRVAQEVRVGHGDIEWMEFLSVLEEMEYRGWLVVEQETGDNRPADVAASVNFLRRFIA